MVDQSEIDAAEERVDKFRSLIDRTKKIVAEWVALDVDGFSGELDDLFSDNEDIMRFYDDLDDKFLGLTQAEPPYRYPHPDTGEIIA